MPPPTRAKSAIEEAPIAKPEMISENSRAVGHASVPARNTEHDRDAGKTERRHREAHHRAAREGHPQRLGLVARARGLGGADVGRGGALHPDPAAAMEQRPPKA